MASFSYKRPHSRHFKWEKKGRSSFMAGLRTRVGNEEGQTVRSRLSHLICPRRFGVEAGFGTWSPESTLGSGRLPWLHRASPSATLDKISEEDCGVAAPRQEFSSAFERRRSREIGISARNSQHRQGSPMPRVLVKIGVLKPIQT